MITVYTGPMYASKSFELLKASSFYKSNELICFKPSKDIRDYSTIQSRNIKEGLNAYVINNLNEIPKKLMKNHKAIIIDEAQFLEGDSKILLNLSLEGYDIYIAGLNLTSEQEPFGIMPQILSIADKIEILKAQCNICKCFNASYTYSLVEKTTQVKVGNDGYISLCPKCLYDKIHK